MRTRPGQDEPTEFEANARWVESRNGLPERPVPYAYQADTSHIRVVTRGRIMRALAEDPDA